MRRKSEDFRTRPKPGRGADSFPHTDSCEGLFLLGMFVPKNEILDAALLSVAGFGSVVPNIKRPDAALLSNFCLSGCRRKEGR